MPNLRARGLNIFEAFGGIGGGRAAADAAGIPVARHWHADINKAAQDIVRRAYPDVELLGDIRNIGGVDDKVDLYCAGFPCQDLSRANTSGKGLAGDRSGLLYEALRLRDRLKPSHFLFENVVPKRQKDLDEITRAIGVDPVMLDAADFGAMRRPRLFWTDLPIRDYTPSTQRFADVLFPQVDPRYALSDRAVAYMMRPAGASGRTHFQRHGMDALAPKARTIPSVIHKGVPYNAVRMPDGSMRKLTPEELERMFGFPAGHTQGVSDTQRYMALGNSWSVPTVGHILRSLAR